MKPPRNILVIRNDKLGDFMLAWPALALLKTQYPGCNITVLVPDYTRPIAEQCRWIDQVIIDKRHSSLMADIKYLVPLIKEKQFDVSISLFSEFRTALALWFARVPGRVAPATKIAQLFYNHRLTQRRSRSEKPEYEYNIDIVKYYIELNGDIPVTPQTTPYLEFDKTVINQIRAQYCEEQRIDNKTRLVIIHPGSGGSAINLSLQQYAELATLVSNRQNLHIIITAGPNELPFATALSALIPAVPHSIYHSTGGLVEFGKFIASCDMFISGSTGPLHIAGALNVPTAAFYPARRSATALRWQTLNDKKNRIAFMPKEFTGKKDMQTIDLNICAQQIIARLKEL